MRGSGTCVPSAHAISSSLPKRDVIFPRRVGQTSCRSRLALHGFEGPPHALFFLADQKHVSSGTKSLDGGVFDGSGCQHTAHIEIVSDDRARDNRSSCAGCRSSTSSTVKRASCRLSPGDKQRAQPSRTATHGAAHDREEDLRSTAASTAWRSRQFAVRIEIGFTQSGKVLAASEHMAFAQSAQKLAGVCDGCLWLAARPCASLGHFSTAQAANRARARNQC